MKCRSQLAIFEFSCLTVIDKLELFDLTETEEAVKGKYLNCGLSSRVANEIRNADTSVKLARNPNIFQIPNHDRHSPNGRNWILVF